jgi:thiamine-phosphate diphosphorylase
MKPTLDPSVYAIVDLGPGGAAPGPEAVEQALAGGVTLLQVRGKRLSGRELWMAARDLARLARARGVPLLVNDRPDVAAAAGADGVHLGQRDLPAAVVRRLHPEWLIGVSVHDPAERTAAEKAGADYVASGSLFPTGTKEDAVPLDHALFHDLCAGSRLPVVGIGGITVERAEPVIRLGAAGVAVIGGLWSAGDVAARAREYRAAVTAGRGQG